MSAITLRSSRPGRKRPPTRRRTRIPSCSRSASSRETNAVGGVVMWACVDMNGIAPVENGLVRIRARSRPAPSTSAKFGRRPSPTGALLEPMRRTVPSPSKSCEYMHGPAAQRSPSTSSSGSSALYPSSWNSWNRTSRPSSRNAAATRSAACAAASLPAVRGPIRPASPSTRFIRPTEAGCGIRAPAAGGSDAAHLARVGLARSHRYALRPPRATCLV